MTMRTNAWMCMAAATAAMVLAPNRADACGGTFCDGGVPQPMPVDQTGENVIFVMGGAQAEVHIQISIDANTNAQKFAWMIPLTAVPDFSVGSQPLFTSVMAATVPTYGLNTTSEVCGDPNDGGSFSGGDPTNASLSDTAGGSTGGDEGSDGNMPEVLLDETVGAFDVVVLKDTELAPIQKWLEDNDYNWDPNAAPILQQYLDEGNVIAALKLTTGADVADVHPITLKYDSNETCFPLRLTRIAAVEDMDIRVFVLASNRAAPTNYRHVLVNPLKIDWLNFATNYKEVITNAVDAMMANGRAFVTEYAGASDMVPQGNIYSASWDDKAFVGLDPILTIDTLNGQNLAFCYDEFSCGWNHPLVFGLLLEFLPPPDGVDPALFYPHLVDYAADIDLVKWNDGAEFSAALLDRVIEPGMHALDLLDTWPYLTRMYTTISPSEMMEDPIFHINADLGDVAQLQIADNYLLCNGDGVVTLPDGREIFVPGSTPWPDIPGEEWWSEEVQTIALKGAPMTLVNNTAAINKKLEEWNIAHDWPRSPSESGGLPTTSESEGGSGGSESSGSDTGSQTGESGCGCDARGDSSLALGLVGLGLLGLRRRRR